MTVGLSRSGARAAALAVAGVLVAALVGCDGDGSEGSGPAPTAPVAAEASVREGTYEWRRVPLGAGGLVTGIVSAPVAEGQAIYSRTDVGGAYRWDENSATWGQMLQASALEGGDLGPDDYSVASIAAAPSDGSVVYLAVGSDYNPVSRSESLAQTGRVLRSTDGGRSWSSSSNRWFIAGNQSFRTGTERLAVDPANPARLFFGTQREGLWRSENGGEDWTQVPLATIPAGIEGDVATDQAGVNMVAFSATGDAGQPPTLYAGVAHTGVFASTDGGTTWTMLLPLSGGEIPMSAEPTATGLLFSIATFDRTEARLLRATGGSAIEEISAPVANTVWHLAVDPGDPERIALTDEAVRDGHLWTSVDGGGSWDAHDIEVRSEEIPWLETTDLDTYMTTGRLMFDPSVPGRLWFAEGMGVWQTGDVMASTVTWRSSARGIEELVVSDITVPPGGVPVVTVADRQGFRIDSLDFYPARTLVDERFASGSSADYSEGQPDVLAWVGAQSNLPPPAPARAAGSEDGGASWQELDDLEPEMYGGEIAVSATDPSVLVWVPTHLYPGGFTVDPVGVYVSDDGGRSWSHPSVDGTVDSFHRFFWWFTRRALAADRVNGDFYLMSDEERFYVSDDGGASWRRARNAPPCTEDLDCHVFGQVQAVPGAAGHLWASTGDGGLYRTDDAGASPWVQVEEIEEARAFAFGAPVGGSEHPAVFVHGRGTGDPELGIWRSIDGGASWTLISRYPLDLAMGVNALAGDPDRPGRVYVGFAGAGAVVGDDPDL